MTPATATTATTSPPRRARWTLPRGWRRRVALRRLAAAALLLAAVALALAPSVAPPTAGVVVARRDLVPGGPVAPDDVEVRRLALDSVPAGALTDTGRAAGRVPVGPVRAGEVLTDVRVVGPEAATVSVGTPDAAGVGLRLADPAVAGLLRAGALVDVVGTTGPAAGRAPPEAAAGVLAARAVVLGVLPAAERSGTGPVVVVALPADAAARVAAATLGQEVTVTLR